MNRFYSSKEYCRHIIHKRKYSQISFNLFNFLLRNFVDVYNLLLPEPTFLAHLS